MSLHIGRLSPDVHQRYLEHIFQEYGRCTVNLKDGYGFAVYNSSDDAARAMRALRGKYVCGERITVNWSKQQPRISQGFRRSSRFESARGRKFRDAGENIRSRDSVALKNQPANHDQGYNPDAMPEKESDKVAEVANDDEENNVDDPGKVKGDEGGSIGEDPVDVKRDEGGTIDVNAIEHDRWAETGKGTPCGEDDDFDRYEPYHGYNRKEETENDIKASSYGSGDRRRSSEKWQEHSDKHVDISHDKSRSPPTCYSCGVAGHIARNCPQGTDDKFKARGDGLNFREKWQLRQRRFGSPSTLRRRPEFYVRPLNHTQYRVQDGKKPFYEKNMRMPSSNVPRENGIHVHCIDNMQTIKEARKRSRYERSRGSSSSSEPSRHSHQDDIKGSPSDSGSRSRRPRSRFRVHSPSYSAHSSSKSFQPTQCEGSRPNINNPVPISVSASPQHKASPDVKNKHLDGLMDSPLEDNLELGTNSEVKNEDDKKQEGKGSALNSKAPNGEARVPDKDANVVNSDENLIDDNAANGVQDQNANFEDPSVKSKPDALVKNGRNKSLKLTTNEAISSLKRYGMETQEVCSSDRPVEKYFGAARLWPWEIIYYRRLKKGPITTENYAKRLEQNREFGIVDQYVRSSSGWWECD